MYITLNSLIIFITIYPLAFFLMVDSGTDFTFRRPQKLLSLYEKSWIDYEGNVLLLLLARFLTGFLLILTFLHLWLQILLIFGLVLLEVLAGQLYLPKAKRE
jgi:hypothetical protein